jgi:hypothetical protein
MHAGVGCSRDQLRAQVELADAAAAAGGFAAGHLLASAPLAYAPASFNEGITVNQVAMRGPEVGQRMLDRARDATRTFNGLDTFKGLGFRTWTSPHVAPPAPEECVRPFLRLRQMSGDLLRGLRLFTITCNKQRNNLDPHVPHFDPSLFDGIAAIACVVCLLVCLLACFCVWWPGCLSVPRGRDFDLGVTCSPLSHIYPPTTPIHHTRTNMYRTASSCSAATSRTRSSRSWRRSERSRGMG